MEKQQEVLNTISTLAGAIDPLVRAGSQEVKVKCPKCGDLYFIDCDCLETNPKSEWENVEDENNLPEIGEYILLCFEEETVLKGRRLHGGWNAFFADGEKSVENRIPTHWQSLPPKDQ